MGEKIRILAVDDEKFNLMLLKKCLSEDEFEVSGCVKAIDAIQLFKKQYFDVVLLDVIMPVLDGFELRKLLRELDKERPIIFLTSMVEDFSTTMLNQISWDPYTYYMNKSFDRELLNTKIKEVVTITRTKKQTLEYYNKLESELSLAGDLQKILLPDWCVMNKSLTVSSIYRPFSKVSGDIFEFFPIDEKRSLLFVGDIVGHGICAALYMSAIQAFLKVSVIGKDFKVHEILNALNSFFCEELESMSYMTALVAIIDTEKNHITVQSAGHPGLLGCSAETEKVWKVGGWDKGGIPIGWFPSTVYEEADTCEADFRDSDVIVTMTDGIMDIATKEGEKLSEKELSDIMGVLSCNADPVTLPYRLMHAIRQMGYTIFNDDICMAALQKRIADPSVFEMLVAPTLPAAAEASLAFSNEAVKRGAPPEIQPKIELLLQEYLNNIIIHGGNGKKSSKNKIQLSMACSDGSLTIRGRDRGRFWDVSEQPDNPAPNPETKASENGRTGISGRGLQIMRTIASSINHSNYCGLNDNTFTVKY